MKKFELSFVQDALDRLAASGFQGILVGGHAVNFWALIYRQQTPEWAALLPYTSEDIDFLGGREEALQCKRLFGGTANLNDETDPSPQAGVILAPLNSGIVRFDIIVSIVGVDSQSVRKHALAPAPSSNLTHSLQVVHPLHCLISKATALGELPQSGRQDLKHLKLCILILHAFLAERVSEPRALLNNIERVFHLAGTEVGLRAWHLHKIKIEEALPLGFIQAQKDERLQKFAETRLPQLTTQLAEARRRYLATFLEE